MRRTAAEECAHLKDVDGGLVDGAHHCAPSVHGVAHCRADTSSAAYCDSDRSKLSNSEMRGQACMHERPTDITCAHDNGRSSCIQA